MYALCRNIGIFCPHAAVHSRLFLPLPKYPNPFSYLYNEKTLQAWICIAFMNSLTKAFWNYHKFGCIHFFGDLFCSRLIFGPVHAFKSNTIVSPMPSSRMLCVCSAKKHKQANIECSVSSAGLAWCAPAYDRNAAVTCGFMSLLCVGLKARALLPS